MAIGVYAELKPANNQDFFIADEKYIRMDGHKTGNDNTACPAYIGNDKYDKVKQGISLQTWHHWVDTVLSSLAGYSSLLVHLSEDDYHLVSVTQDNTAQKGSIKYNQSTGEYTYEAAVITEEDVGSFYSGTKCIDSLSLSFDSESETNNLTISYHLRGDPSDTMQEASITVALSNYCTLDYAHKTFVHVDGDNMQGLLKAAPTGTKSYVWRRNEDGTVTQDKVQTEVKNDTETIRNIVFRSSSDENALSVSELSEGTIIMLYD